MRRTWTPSRRPGQRGCQRCRRCRPADLLRPCRAGLFPGARLLDLGCGPGDLTATVAGIAHEGGAGGSVLGLDASPTQVEHARALLDELSARYGGAVSRFFPEEVEYPPARAQAARDRFAEEAVTTLPGLLRRADGSFDQDYVRMDAIARRD